MTKHRLLPRPELTLGFLFGAFSRCEYTRICVHSSPPRGFFLRDVDRNCLRRLACCAKLTCRRWEMGSSDTRDEVSRHPAGRLSRVTSAAPSLSASVSATT